MSRRNRDSIENLSGLQELDRLVVQVIRALQSGPLQDGRNVRDDNVIYRDKWGESAYGAEHDGVRDEGDPLRSERPTSRLKSPLADGDWPDGADVPVTEDWAKPLAEEVDDAESRIDEPTAPESSENSALSEAEIAFIDRTSRWLERRPHRDIILDQIWRRLLPKDVAESATDDTGEDNVPQVDEPQVEQSQVDDEAAEDTDAID